MFKYTRLTQLLEDLIPLLNKYQVEFLEYVDSILECIVSKSKPPSNDYEVEKTEIGAKVELILKNMQIIIDRLKEGIPAKKSFIEMYPKWRKVRTDSIEMLKEIAVSLNKDRFNCNAAKLTGYAVSFVGGALCLASAVTIPLTLGATTPLAIAGGAMTGAGCAATIGTSVTEVVLLKSKVGRAQEIIKEDEKCYQDLSGWLKHAAQLEELLAEVLAIDIIKDIAEDIRDFVKKAFALPRDIARRQFVEKALNMIIKTLPVKLTEAVSVLSIAAVISVLVGLFVLLINTKTRIVFDCAHFTMRSVLGVAALADDSVDVLRITKLFTSNAVLAKDLAKAITRGALSVAGMALDATGIALTSIDVHKGSLSPEAEKISQASEELEKETKTIDEVYDMLRA